MNGEIFNKSHAKVMASLILWAYENDVDVDFFKGYEFGGYAYPVLRFTKHGKSLETNFFLLEHSDKKAEYVWKDIALRLAVVPPRFE